MAKPAAVTTDSDYSGAVPVDTQAAATTPAVAATTAPSAPTTTNDDYAGAEAIGDDAAQSAAVAKSMDQMPHHLQAVGAGIANATVHAGTSLGDAAMNVGNLFRAGGGVLAYPGTFNEPGEYHRGGLPHGNPMAGPKMPDDSIFNMDPDKWYNQPDPIGTLAANKIDQAAGAHITSLANPNNRTDRFLFTGASAVPYAGAAGLSEGLENGFGAGVRAFGRNVVGAQLPAAAGQSVFETQPFQSDAENEIASNVLASTVGEVPVGFSALAKRLVRGGGEATRQNMVQNIQDFRQATGQDPTLGLATGNREIQRLEQSKASISPDSKLGQRFKDYNTGAEQTTNAAVSGMGGLTTGAQAGNTIGAIPHQFKVQQVGETPGAPGSVYGGMEQNLSQLIAQENKARVAAGQPPIRVLPTNQLPAMNDAVHAGFDLSNPEDKNALDLSLALGSSKMNDLRSKLITATQGTPPTPATTIPGTPAKPGKPIISSVIGPDGKPMVIGQSPATPAGPSRTIPGQPGTPPGLSWQNANAQRTAIGNLAFPSHLLTAPEQSAANVYHAAGADMQEALKGTAAAPVQAANDAFYKNVQIELDKMKDLALGGNARSSDMTGRNLTPETIASRYLSAATSKIPDETTLTAFKKAALSVDPTGNKFAAANSFVMDQLGNPTAGEIGKNKDYSISKFAQRWNTMPDHIKDLMFSGYPNADAQRASFDAIARVGTKINQAGGVVKNPDQLPNTNRTETRAKVGLWAAITHPDTAMAIYGTLMAAGHFGQKAALSPKTLNWAARKTSPIPGSALGQAGVMYNQTANQGNTK